MSRARSSSSACWRRCARGIARLASPALLAAGLAAAHPAAASADRDGTLRHQDVERHYLLHLPDLPHPSDGPAAPRPLVVALHGLGQSVASLRRWWTMDALADREGFAVAYPEALDGGWSYSPQRPVPQPGGTGPGGAGPGGAGPGGTALVDDVGFVAALVDRLVATGIADPKRVFVAGVSRGGLLIWTLLCDAPERFAAAAPMITGMIDHQLATCRPHRLIPVMALAGTDDPVQPYDGWLYDTYRLASVPETMEFWRRLHGCTGQSARVLAHRDRLDRTRVAVIDWTGCGPGGALRLYRIAGGGHQIPTLAPIEGPPPPPDRRRNRDMETAEAVWQFFAAVPR